MLKDKMFLQLLSYVLNDPGPCFATKTRILRTWLEGIFRFC